MAAKKKPAKRKADVFAGKGSFAEKLKKRRQAMEEGNPEKAGEAMKSKKKKK